MSENEIENSRSTAVDLETVRAPRPIKFGRIFQGDVNPDLIDHLDVIPDPIEQTQFPFTVVVPVGNRFKRLEGKSVISPTVPVPCIIIESGDTSEASLALLQVSLRMTGLLIGKLNYVEQIRNISILYNLHAADKGLIINKNGGDRRSASFNEMEGKHICGFIAEALDRSSSTIRIALDHTRFLNLSAMNELARRKATKRFITAACLLRTEVLSKLPENLSEQEMTDIVSSKFLEWFSLYNPATGEIEIPQDEKDRNRSESEKQSVSTENETLSAKDTLKEQKKEVAANAETEEVKAISPLPGPVPEKNNITEKTADDESPDELAENLDEEANNDIITGGIPLLPEVTLNNVQESTVKDIFQRLEKIGKALIKISQDKPAQELLCEQVGDIIREIIRLFPKAQVTNFSLSTTTLSGGNLWDNSCQSAAARA